MLPTYQVSVHLAVGFQSRRLKCEKLTDDRQRTSNDGKSSPWQGELKRGLIRGVISLEGGQVTSILLSKCI